MPLNGVLGQFKTNATQCDSLIASAHKMDGAGGRIFSITDTEQIAVAAFLNLFIAWEAFLEESLAQFMIGNPTISGRYPVRFGMPRNVELAKKMAIGTQRYFDYANHDNMRRIAGIYFANGYPYEPHLSGIFSELQDLKTMRNAAAHVTSTTRAALESLGVRLLGAPCTGIRLYTLLTSTLLGSSDTVFKAYRDKLIIAAELIATG